MRIIILLCRRHCGDGHVTRVRQCAEASQGKPVEQVAAVEQAPQPVDPNGYHAASGMEQVKAYCELVANGLQPGGSFVMGSPSFVAGAAIGSAIGGAITHAQNYDHCMVLKGYAHN